MVGVVALSPWCLAGLWETGHIHPIKNIALREKCYRLVHQKKKGGEIR